MSRDFRHWLGPDLTPIRRKAPRGRGLRRFCRCDCDAIEVRWFTENELRDLLPGGQQYQENQELPAVVKS